MWIAFALGINAIRELSIMTKGGIATCPMLSVSIEQSRSVAIPKLLREKIGPEVDHCLVKVTTFRSHIGQIFSTLLGTS
jgi:hypothetical protein